MIDRRSLWTASGFAIALATAPAAAQTSLPGGAPSTAVADQPGVAAPAGDEIIVTGVRASLKTAQATKQNSQQVVDSIASEDIGKLPDNTVSDALQRVTGVQVQRGGGEATTVLVRGLPNVQSYLNGREIFTGTLRGVALQDIPAELVAGVDVFKTTTPDMIEGGVAGRIDIRLRRPFDFDGLAVAGSARGIYGDQAGKWSYIGSGLVSNRWETGAGEFGILIGASYNKRRYEDQTAFNFGYGPLTVPGRATPLLTPATVGAIYNVGNRERPAGNIALQWKPAPNLEFYADGAFTGFREDFDVNFFIGLPGAGAIQPGATAVAGGDFAQSLSTVDNFTITSKQAFRRKTDGYQGNFGGKWTSGGATLTGEVTYSDSTVRSDTIIVDTAYVVPRIDYNFNAGGTPNLTITGVDITDGRILNLLTLFEPQTLAKSKQLAAHADLNYDLDSGLLSAVKAGVRYARRTGNSGGTDPGAFPIAFVPVGGFPGIVTQSPGDIIDGKVGIDRFALASSSYLRANIDTLRGLANRPLGDPAFDPNRVFRLTETNYAGYAQAAYRFDLGTVPIDGVVGARVVNVKTDLDAFQTLLGVVSPIARAQDYTKVLPSVSVRARPADAVQLRLVLGKSITRPEFDQLNPAAGLIRAGNTTFGTGTGGNADLAPIRSDNVDATAEWYFSATGSLTTSAFYRKLKGYVVAFAQPETFDGSVYQVTRPRSQDGSLKGAEIAYQQFFDFLPGALSGFGAQANFTYIKGKFFDPVAALTRPLPQVSKTSYNLVAIYEKYGLSARLAYNWRSRFVDSYNVASSAPSQITVAPLKFLDFSASYAVTEAITLTVDATNLLDETYRDQFGTDGATPRDTRSYDRTIGAGVRFRF